MRAHPRSRRAHRSLLTATVRAAAVVPATGAVERVVGAPGAGRVECAAMGRWAVRVGRLALGFLAVAAATAGAPASAVQRCAILQDVIHDDDAPPARQDDFLDTTILVAWPRAHVQLTLGSFATGVQAGGFVRDRRGSTYGGALRRRQEGFVADTSLDVESLQKLGRTVLGGQVRCFWPDHPEGDPLLVVPAASVEVYYRDESFASLRVVRDPRRGTGTSFRIANRLGTRRAHLEVAVAPRTDGVLNWSVGGRWGLFLLGFGRERDFDFTRLDREVLTFGFRWDLAP